MFFNKFGDKLKNLFLSSSEFSYGNCPVPSVLYINIYSNVNLINHLCYTKK